MRIGGLIFLVLVDVLPWLWLTTFAVLTAVATLQVGHLPSYGDPDPKQVSALLRNGVLLLALATVMSPLVVGAELAWRFWTRRPIRRRALVAYLIGLGVFTVVGLFDAFGLIAWLLD